MKLGGNWSTYQVELTVMLYTPEGTYFSELTLYNLKATAI